jgi:hypothetical protein
MEMEMGTRKNKIMEEIPGEVVNPVKPNENKTNDSKPNPQIKPEVKPSNPKPNDQKPQVNPGVKRGGN